MSVASSASRWTHTAPDESAKAGLPSPEGAPDLLLNEAPRKRIGDLAIERGLVSREHVELCAELQRALRKDRHARPKRLGEILIEKGLLRSEHLAALLLEQKGVSAQDRQALAGSASKMRERVAATARVLRRPVPRWAQYLALVALVSLGWAAVVRLWPGPASQRTLEAYLRGRGESPDARADYLALCNLGIEVDHFRVETMLTSVQHDYASDIRACTERGGSTTWRDFPKWNQLSEGKRRALELVLPGLREDLKYLRIEDLTITIQPIRVTLFYRQVGERFFRREQCDFSLVRLDSSHWSFGWRVAAYQSLEPAS